MMTLKGLGLPSLALAAALACPFAAVAQSVKVDLKLILATDISGSITDEELKLERDGTAQAFLDPEVLRAIQAGSFGRIAVATLDFASPDDNKVTVDWRIVSDKASAQALADAIRAAPRSIGRNTSISGALQLATQLMQSSEKDFAAMRRVVDVSGDGPNNDGIMMTTAHADILAKGIVVNGLPILADRGYIPELDKYYAACVAGGKASFVIVVHSFKDFGVAMRRKLILEIAGIEPESQFARATPVFETGFVKIASARPAPAFPDTARPLEVLRPGPNALSSRCNNFGGPGTL